MENSQREQDEKQGLDDAVAKSNDILKEFARSTGSRGSRP